MVGYSSHEKQTIIGALFGAEETAKAWYYAGDIKAISLQNALLQYRANVLQATNPVEARNSVELVSDPAFKKGVFQVKGANQFMAEIGLGHLTAELYRARNGERAVDFNQRVYAAPARISALDQLGLNYNPAILK